MNVIQLNSDMEKYIGYPYDEVPNPFDDGEPNYAKHFQKEFEDSIKEFGIEMEYRYQADMYKSGKYKDYVIMALKKRAEIFDILSSFRTQGAKDGERETYYPVSIYCSNCNKDTTKIMSLSDEMIAEYKCSCGHHGLFDFNTDYRCKLSWKIDWPMRWMYEGVDFEPGGKDHASPGGSFDTSCVISQKIFGHQPPIFQGYEFSCYFPP